MPPIRIVVADRTVLLRTLVRIATSSDPTIVVGETGSGRELLELCETMQPDVVVMNPLLEDGDAGGFVVTLSAMGIRVLVLTDDPSPERLTALLADGACGYLTRDVAPEALIDAVMAVAAGNVPLHPVAAATLVDQWRRLRRLAPSASERHTLTAREAEVLEAMADGLSTKAIAIRLGVASKTVENHKTRVFDKLGVRGQAHAVATAITHGLLSMGDRTPAGTP